MFYFYIFTLWRMIWAPYCGWRVIDIVGPWAYAGESSNEKCCKIIDKAIFASIKEKFCPMHILGPHPKGKNETLPFVAFRTPSENLSGLNCLASSPHNSQSWWTKTVGRKTWTPAGNVMFPNFKSLLTSWASPSTGGYNLRTSFKIILTWCKKDL